MSRATIIPKYFTHTELALHYTTSKHYDATHSFSKQASQWGSNVFAYTESRILLYVYVSQTLGCYHNGIGWYLDLSNASRNVACTQFLPSNVAILSSQVGKPMFAVSFFQNSPKHRFYSSSDDDMIGAVLKGSIFYAANRRFDTRSKQTFAWPADSCFGLNFCAREICLYPRYRTIRISIGAKITKTINQPIRKVPND